jgi:hypothetical protein
VRTCILLAALALALAGCQTNSSTSSSTTQVASGPKAIDALTDQKLVYSCPTCGMDFDAPGKCTMEGATLVETKIDYICPADNKPVDQAGKCPRCAANARIDRTAVASTDGAAPATPEAPKTETPSTTPPATGSSGS